MTDIPTISAVLGGIKTATDLVKLLSKPDPTMKEVDRKTLLLKLLDSLADTKLALADLQEQLSAKDNEIDTLKEALRLKASLIRNGPAYFERDESGNPTGDPYCQTCFESTGRLLHLVRPQPDEPMFAEFYTCQICKSNFNIASR